MEIWGSLARIRADSYLVKGRLDHDLVVAGLGMRKLWVRPDRM